MGKVVGRLLETVKPPPTTNFWLPYMLIEATIGETCLIQLLELLLRNIKRPRLCKTNIYNVRYDFSAKTVHNSEYTIIRNS